MDAKSSHVSAGFTAHPDDTHLLLSIVLDDLGLVDSSDSELSLDGGNKRGLLEHRTGELLESLIELARVLNVVVETNDTDVLFTSTLLSLHETSSTVKADDEASGDLRIESAGVAGLLHLSDAIEELLHPRHDLVRGRVGRLIQINNTVLQVLFHRSAHGV